MADFGGTVVGSGLNTILAVGLEETTYGTAAAAEMWSSLVDELTITREDQVYEARGITNVRTTTALTTTASRYPVSLRGKMDSGVPFAMAAGYISATSNPTIAPFRGATHTTPSKVYLPSWTVERSFDDESDNLSINGVTFDTGTFACDLDGPWTFDLSGTGKSQATAAATGVAIPATYLGSWNTTVGIDLNATAWASSDYTISGLRNISFSVTNNLRIVNEFGTSSPVAIRQPKYGYADIELTLTRGYIDDDLWDQIADGGTNSFQVATTDGTRTLTWEFDDCRTTTTEQPITSEEDTIETATMKVKDCNLVVASDGVQYVIWD